MNNRFKKLFSYLGKFFLRVPLQEKIILARHLSIMIKAGLPLLDSVIMLQKQTKSKSLAKILGEVAGNVSNGQFLSKSLEKYQDIFGDLFINIIRIGEGSGTLSDNLNYLSEELKKKAELKKKVIGALVYPIVILVATFGITGLLTIFIFPKILPIFSSLNVELPITTRTLIFVSNLLTQRGPLIAGIFVSLVVLFIFLLKIKVFGFYYNLFLLRVPFLGNMIRNVNMANFMRTLGLLLKSGVKIVEAVNITADALSNPVYRNELKQIALGIQKGESISKYLSLHPHFFPPMIANMVAVGENTGNLSETLLYLAGFYESEIDEATKNLSNVLEPALMIIMGLMVGFVAISIITPIYEVTSGVGN